MDREELTKTFAERGIRKVKVGGFDIDGVLRGKLIHLDKFDSAAENGFGFCDVIFGWDAADALYDNAHRHRLGQRLPGRPGEDRPRAPSACCPSEPDTACFLVDFHDVRTAASRTLPARATC